MGDASVPESAASADRVLRALGTTLTRWFEPYGHHAVLLRALAEARSAHPALGEVRVHGATDPPIRDRTGLGGVSCECYQIDRMRFDRPFMPRAGWSSVSLEPT